MNAILQRDRWILASFFAAMTVTNGLILMSLDAWVTPREDLFFGLQLTAWIAGFTLAAILRLRDLIEGTEEFFAHRPISRRRLFDGTWLAGTGCLALGTLVPLGVAVLLGPVLRPHPAADLSFAWLYLGTATVGVAMFSAVLFGLTAPMNWAWRGAITLGVAFAVVLLASALSKETAEGAGASIGLYVAWMLGLAAVLIAVARAQVSATPDADRPVRAAGAVAVTLGVAAWVGIVTIGLAGIQAGVAHEVDLPYLFVEADGTVRRLDARDQERPAWAPYDQTRKSRQTGEVRVGSFEDVHFIPRNDSFHYSYLDHYYYLHGASRKVRIHPRLWRRDGELRVLGRAPDGAPFSRDAEATQLDEEHSLVLLEPELGELWVWPLHSKSTLFTRLELPGGDRPLGEVRRQDPDSGQSIRLIRGERGVYVVQRGSARKLGGAVANNSPGSRYDADTTELDPIAPRVKITRADGTVLFDKVVVGGGAAPAVLPVLSWLRPPLLTLASTTAPARSTFVGYNPFDATAFVDPLVAGGKRWWFVIAHGVFGALLAWLGSRRLTRLGASPRRRAGWALLIFSGGLLAYALQRGIETPRAYRPVRAPAEPTAAPRLLLHSA